MGQSFSVSDNLLYYSHLGAAVLHGTEALAGFTLTNLNPEKGRFPIVNNITYPRTLGTTKGETVVQSDVQLGNIISCFPALSMLNHLWAVFQFKNYLQWVDEKKTNPVRWAEYSVSAGLMTLVIAMLSGEADIKSILQLLFTNVVMQQCGGLIEEDVAEARRSGSSGNRFHQARRRAMTHEILGFILFFSIWITLFTSFFTSVNKVQNDTSLSSNKIPDIIYAIIFVLLFFFLLFGMVSCAQVYGLYNPKSKLALTDFRKVELLYLILSFSSKSALFGMNFGGVIFSQNSVK